MPIPSFTQGYPPDGSSLGQTKATIRNNLDGTFQTLAVDHIDNNGNPGAKPAGYHNVTHWVPQGSDPVAIAGYGQLYSKTITPIVSDEALFWETGTGLVQQLTVNLTPSATTNGYSFIAGGLILQWMTVANPVVAVDYNFPIVFPTNVFNIQLTGIVNDSSTIRLFVDSGSVTTTKFQIQATSSSHFTGMYVFAIGN